MALQGLYPVTPDEMCHRVDTMTKMGYPIYDGSPAMFSEWEFRTKLKMKTTRDEDKHKISSHLVEALHGQAASVAQDLGMEVLANEDGPAKVAGSIKERCIPTYGPRSKITSEGRTKAAWSFVKSQRRVNESLY